MGTGAPPRTVWRHILSCVSTPLSCIVAAPPSFLMIWALARLLAPCGDVFCFVCRHCCPVQSRRRLFFNDMGTSATSRTVPRRILSCVSARMSYIVAAPPRFLMIWALARLLAPCGDVLCFVCRRGCLVDYAHIYIYMCVYIYIFIFTLHTYIHS